MNRIDELIDLIDDLQMQLDAADAELTSLEMGDTTDWDNVLDWNNFDRVVEKHVKEPVMKAVEDE